MNPDRHQDIIDSSLGIGPPLQKIHQNPFITFGDILFTRTKSAARRAPAGSAGCAANNKFLYCRDIESF